MWPSTTPPPVCESREPLKLLDFNSATAPSSFTYTGGMVGGTATAFQLPYATTGAQKITQKKIGDLKAHAPTRKEDGTATKSLKMKRRSSAMSERLEAYARRVREVQKWKVLYGEKQRLLGKSLKNSTRLMIELIQLGCRKPEDVRLVRVMPGLLDALSREKQILERLGASNATFRDYSGFRDFLQRLSEEQPPVLKAQAWETQCSNKQRLLLNSMKKTARLTRDIVALERRKPEDARVAVAGFLGQDEEVKEQKLALERLEGLLVVGQLRPSAPSGE